MKPHWMYFRRAWRHSEFVPADNCVIFRLARLEVSGLCQQFSGSLSISELSPAESRIVNTETASGSLTVE